jgi:hypothetical protein
VDFGGGIANVGGTVTLNHSQVTGNTAAIAGGGIASATLDPSSVAKLTLNNSAVTDNSQTADPSNPNALGGGGIVNLLGTATLNSSQVNHNTAKAFVGGGIASGDYISFSDTSSVLTLNNSQVNDNTVANGDGGGIQNLLGTATLNSSRVDGNTAGNGGGGIQNQLGSVTINSSQVDGNTSLNGGGIASGPGFAPPPGTTSHLVLNKSEVDGNTATAGPGEGPPLAAGGIANGGDAVLNNSQVDNNTASTTSGGGIVNHATMTLNKSEVNGNTAGGSGGGIINTPTPGSVPVVILTLNHSLVIDNTAAHGGGIFNSGGTVILSASTVTGNHPDNCEPLNSIPGCVG